MYETVRIVSKLKPKYVLWENVKNLLSKKHKHNFDNYIETMSIIGYNSYYKVLDAKDYGVPQHRERVYTVSIRKDIDNWDFVFPEPMELKLRLKDVLENEVEEKYYLSDRMVNFFYKNEQIQKEKGNGFRFGVSDGNVVAKSVTTRAGSRMDDNFIKITDAEVSRIGGIFDTEKSKHQAGSVYDKEGLCPTLDAMQGGWRQPSIITVGNYMPSNHNASRIVDSNGLAPTVKENHSTVTATNVLKSKDKRLCSLVNKTNFEEGKVLNMDLYNQTTNEDISQCLTEPHHNTQRLFDGFRIRKLTPKECWRLMGFDDEDFEKAAGVPTSNTQLYKQAGNSIVVNVLENILTNLFNTGRKKTRREFRLW